MNFERHKETKEALQIGKVWKTEKVFGIHLKVRDKNMPDTRPIQERRFSKSPQTLESKILKGKDCHIILGLMQDKKTLWEFIFQIFPNYIEELKKDTLQAGLLVLLEPALDTTGYPALSRTGCFGKDLFYDGKIYSIPNL